MSLRDSASSHAPSGQTASDATGGRSAWWETFWHDVKYAARGLRRKPAFAATIIVTLGLGIGANATMFSIVDRLLFRPPPFLHAPDRVQRLYLARTFDREGEQTSSSLSYKRYLELTEWAKTIDRSAAFFTPELAIGTGEAAREMRVGAVSASFWSLFDIAPVIGRFFNADEDRVPAGTPVAVLGHGYWQANFGGRRDAIGKPLNVGSTVYTIIGVAPAGFMGVASRAPAVFIPITASASDLFGGNGFMSQGGPGDKRPTYYGSHNMSWLEMLVRRKPGVSLEATTADLTTAYRRSYTEQLTTENSLRPIELARPHAVVASVLEERGPNQGSDSKVALWLVGVAAIVLLIACANVGNLLLAKAFGRRREIAVRLALGVSRRRLMRQLLTESFLLAALGAGAGLAFAQWGGGILRAALIPNVDWSNSFTDPRVLYFAVGAALLAGLLTGLAPAWHTGRGDIAATLKAGVREGTYQRSRTRVALLVLQAAMSVVLLVGAGLFVRSLRNVQTLSLGYDTERVLFVSPEMRGLKLDDVASNALRRRLLEQAEALPFVERAGRTVTIPFWMSMTQDLYVAGIDSVSRLGDFYYHAVSPGYFATMGTTIRRGRGITEADSKNAPRVIVVSESMARKLWPGREALGQCVKVGADTMPCSEVVGVAQDIRRESLNKDAGLQYYVSIEQSGNTGALFVRTRGEAPPMADQLRRELQKVMPGASYITVTPLQSILGSQTRSWTLGATMFTIFGGLALLLAAIGLYSVIAYNVAQRTHELGVRLALGARATNLVGLVVREGVMLAAVGVLIGGLVALVAGRYIGPLLFDVTPKDPSVFVAVALVLLGVALLASIIPARRAARVDPSVALRSD